MDLIRDLERVLGNARAMIASVPPDALSARTPCTEWDVRGVIAHMTGVCQNYIRGLQGLEMDRTLAGARPDVLGDDPAASFARAADALLREVREPGALDKMVKMVFGEVPAWQALPIALADQMVHTWDLAQALGRPFTMDESLAAASLQLMQQILPPERRAAGTAFGEEIACPADASAQDRLLAFSGRRP